MIDIKKLCFDVQDLVLETAKMIRKERENFKPDEQVEEKGQNDFVTSIDKLSEEMLVKGLSERLPESGFVVEEGTSSKKGETYNWVIDPIDGTTNFIHGVAPHSISIALMRGDELILGVVYEIVHGEMFYAWEGSAAYLNGDKIRVSNTGTNKHVLVVTGFPYTNFSKINNYFDAMLELMEQTSGIRRLGSAAIDLCYVACGRFDAFWEYGLHAWDVAAGAFIVKQAGGKVCDFEGTIHYIDNGNIIATNNNYFNIFYEIVNRHLGNDKDG